MSSFPTTRWSLVLKAGGSESNSKEALESLCRIYWRPVYAFARRREFPVEQAEDLTQGFFARLLEKHAIDRADSDRGKFRSFLLASFKNYLANEKDREQAEKRGGKHQFVSLDFSDAERHLGMEPAGNTTPETAFMKLWVRTLLDRTLDQLRDEMQRSGKAERYDALKGFLTGDEPDVGYAQVAADLKMSEGAVKVTVHRMRRQFSQLLRAEVAHTVDDPNEVSGELRFLAGAL